MSKCSAVRIANLAFAVPDLIIDQTETFEKVFRHLFAEVPSAPSIFRNAGIRKRHWYCDPAAWTTDGAPTRRRPRPRGDGRHTAPSLIRRRHRSPCRPRR